LRRLHEEWGLTVVMSEHRLERCFHLADRILLFERGRISFDGTPRQFAAIAMQSKTDWQSYLPPVTRELAGRLQSDRLPLTVREARSLLPSLPEDVCSVSENRPPGKEILGIYRGRAGYEPKTDVLKNVTYRICEGDHIALFGENGAGKSTLAKVFAGVLPLTAGEIRWKGRAADAGFWQTAYTRIGYLSQNPNDYFLHDTVEDELIFSLKQSSSSGAGGLTADDLLDLLGLEPYRNRHPHDLSGGERQRLALGIVLAARPQVLLLDEPTRGLDPFQKQKLCSLLHRLPAQAVVVITHDVEFARDYANRVSVLYDGDIVTDSSPDEVFRHSFAYAPQAYRIRR
jgi:energy-coupling factor transporter ATP-binding protein EcfA2